MRTVLFILVSLACLQVHANLKCTSSTKDFSLELQQAGTDVAATLENKFFINLGYLQSREAGNKRYRLSGSTKTTHRLQKVTVNQLIQDKLATDLIVSVLLSRSELEGDYDLTYSIAAELSGKLKCTH